MKHNETINKICSSLFDCLDISVFTYGFVDADGSIGYLTNALEFNEYYFSQKLYLENPYLSHPALFRTGHTICNSGFEKNIQKILRKKFDAGPFLLNLQTNGSRMEYFIYSNPDIEHMVTSKFLNRIDLLRKFEQYFRNEARDLIGKMHAEKFNICAARGEKLFENPQQVPLSNNNPKILSFLKNISRLSQQELNDLEYFRQIPFTPREKEVLQQLLMGYYASEVAANLFLSNRTIEHYIENIKEKLNCKSKFDLIKKIRNLEFIGYLF